MPGKPSVLVTQDDLPSEVLSLLRENCDLDVWTGSKPMPRDELLKRIVGKEGIVCLLTNKMDGSALEAAGPSLKIISSFSVGLDHVDIKAARSRGIKIGHTPDVLTDAVSELAMGLLLATARRFFEARAEILNGGWGQSAFSPLWMCGKELRNSVVGIAGMGRIGFGLQKRLQAFNVARVLYTSRAAKQHADDLGAERVPFDTLLAESDFVVCCLALTPETKDIFDKKAFENMKKSAIFVNVSRGGLVNQDDLISALKSGAIAAAGLDVMTPEPLPSDHELLRLKNCTVIPHIGSATYETRLAMGMLAAGNLINGLKGEPMPAEYRD